MLLGWVLGRRAGEGGGGGAGMRMGEGEGVV